MQRGAIILIETAFPCYNYSDVQTPSKQKHKLTNLWISGVFRTQNLEALTVCLTLRVIHITEQPCGSETDTNVRGDTALTEEETDGQKGLLTPQCVLGTWNQTMSDSRTVEQREICMLGTKHK